MLSCLEIVSGTRIVQGSDWMNKHSLIGKTGVTRVTIPSGVTIGKAASSERALKICFRTLMDCYGPFLRRVTTHQ